MCCTNSFFQLLLNMLAENRQLTCQQYDRIVRYLESRRDIQSKFELEEGVPTADPPVDDKAAELQNRIMNILNKPTPEPTPKPVVKPASQESTPLLNDPSVQKALDSLLLGDMFKNIAGV